MLGGEPRRQSLEGLTHRIELDDFVMSELSDQEPSPGTENEKPALLQALERFTHRRTADPQVARDVFLAHALPAGDPTVRNGVPQALIHEVRARPAGGH